MKRWRILKEEPVPESEWIEGDLSSHSKFAPTGEEFEGSPEDLQARLQELQAGEGGCYAAEEVKS